jgi:hypothetical protein
MGNELIWGILAFIVFPLIIDALRWMISKFKEDNNARRHETRKKG